MQSSPPKAKVETSEKSESCPHALIAAVRQGIYGTTYSPKLQVQQPPGG